MSEGGLGLLQPEEVGIKKEKIKENKKPENWSVVETADMQKNVDQTESASPVDIDELIELEEAVEVPDALIDQDQMNELVKKAKERQGEAQVDTEPDLKTNQEETTKPETPTVDAEDNPDSSQESLPNVELAKQWVDHFVTFDVRDEYALHNVKNKKDDEKKRETVKYRQHFDKVSSRFVPGIIEKIIQDLDEGALDSESSDDEIKKRIVKILRSELRVIVLAKIIQESKFAKITAENNNQVKTDGEKKDKNKPEEAGTGNVETAIETTSGETGEKEEFLEKYELGKVYVDPVSGSEIVISEYDAEKNEVTFSTYTISTYDKTDDAHAFTESGQRTEKRVLSREDFLREFEKAVLQEEIDNKTEFEAKIESLRERHFFINEKGEYLQVKNVYDGRRSLREGGRVKRRVQVVGERWGGKTGKMDVAELESLIKKEQFTLFEKTSDVKTSFTKEFFYFKNGGNKNIEVEGLNLRKDQNKFLARIKELDGKYVYASVEEVRVITDLWESLSEKEMGLVRREFLEYVENYKEELEGWLEEQGFDKDGTEKEREKYLEKLWDVYLSEHIDSAGDLLSLNKKEEIIKYLQFQEKQN